MAMAFIAARQTATRVQGTGRLSSNVRPTWSGGGFAERNGSGGCVCGVAVTLLTYYNIGREEYVTLLSVMPQLLCEGQTRFPDRV